MKKLAPLDFFISNQSPGDGGLPETQDELFKIMQAYAEHCEESAWVSVDERLPEFETDNCTFDVLVLADGLHVTAYFDKRFNKWVDCRTSDHLGRYDVTHWRPLPSSPKNTEQ